MIKKCLSLLLFVLFVLLLRAPQSELSYPFIPPLIHSPQMSLSSIGTPKPPAHFLLKDLEVVTQSQCQKCTILLRQQQEELEQGKMYRLQLQATVEKLLLTLPSSFIGNARKNRSQHSQKIGEVWVWEQLSQQD